VRSANQATHVHLTRLVQQHTGCLGSPHTAHSLHMSLPGTRRCWGRQHGRSCWPLAALLVPWAVSCLLHCIAARLMLPALPAALRSAAAS
jgi:hypothetical protein